MPALAELLPIVHLALLAAFVGVASVFMLTALISHLRVRRTKLTWRTGLLRGVPLGPALFTLAVSSGLVYAWTTGYPVKLPLLVGYPAAGLFWCIGAFLSRSVLITDYGIIHDINRISQAVAWGQIVDYFVAEDGGQLRYVFLYRDENRSQRRRLELRVPAHRAEAFHELVTAKLDARFAFSMEQAHDKKTLEE